VIYVLSPCVEYLPPPINLRFPMEDEKEGFGEEIKSRRSNPKSNQAGWGGGVW